MSSTFINRNANAGQIANIDFNLLESNTSLLMNILQKAKVLKVKLMNTFHYHNYLLKPTLINGEQEIKTDFQFYNKIL